MLSICKRAMNKKTGLPQIGTIVGIVHPCVVLNVSDGKY